ncbi:MAG: acetylglutamate kinase [Pirellulales bacterium]|nr:acetylglutamate kinase [Pirellulales bacterium]
MQDAIAKADVLIEALHWIRRFRDKVTVIKIGGRVIDDADALRHLLLDVVFMETVGMRPVIVHGGGAAITRGMEEAGLQPRFIEGRRYTDDKTLEIVERVLAYETNTAIADKIEELGGRAAPLNFRTTCALQGEPLKLKDDGGKEIDLGHVGTVTQVDRSTIENLCYANIVPVIPSMCWGPDRTKLNVNADTAATAIAQSIGAEKMVYVSDVNGVRRDKEDPDSLIASLSASEARQLMADGITDAGMIPKLEACLATLDYGVKKVHIVDGRLRHSLLLEIYTTSGVGTEIARDE